MSDEQSVQSALSHVVERHLPSASEKLPGNWGELTRYSEMYASSLISADIYETEGFGVSHDALSLEKLDRALREARGLAVSLSPSAHRAVKHESPFYWTEERDDVLLSAVLHIDELRRAVAGTRKRAAFRKAASRKLNYRAASVVRECRHVWAKEEYRANPNKYPFSQDNALFEIGLTGEERRQARQQRLAYEAFVDDFANRTEKNDRPGPFGEFAQDVFRCLNIMSRRDPEEPFRAASALDALARLEEDSESSASGE